MGAEDEQWSDAGGDTIRNRNRNLVWRCRFVLLAVEKQTISDGGAN
jgi:hypothetical protein